MFISGRIGQHPSKRIDGQTIGTIILSISTVLFERNKKEMTTYRKNCNGVMYERMLNKQVVPTVEEMTEADRSFQKRTVLNNII